MSRWVKFNIVIFITIVLLAVLVRFVTPKNPLTENSSSPTPSPSAIVSPQTSPTATTSGAVDPEVLGLAVETSEASKLAELAVYESKKLSFMTMLPADFNISNDVLRYQPQEDTVVVQPNPGSCTFTTISKQPYTVSEEKTLAEFDLPLVVYKKLEGHTGQAGTHSIYVLKNEENVSRLELHCTSDWQVSEAFYTILRSVRFN